MSLNRYAKRRDANEPELITLARRIGALCHRTDKPLDWLIGWRGAWYPTEIKLPAREGRKDEFEPEQQMFITDASNARLPVWVWHTDADVMRCLGARSAA